MKRTLRLSALFMATLLVLFSLLSCSAAEGGAVKDDMEESVSVPEEGADLNQSSVDLKENRKIIERIRLSLQTKTFDALMDDVKAQVSALGGYVQQAEVNGRQEDSDSMRWANMTVRIPSEKSESFSDFVSQKAVVINRSVTTEDVTLSYVDMESRISAMRLEKEALETLLKNAASVQDIISIREKLTDVIYQIESYESQLRTWDDLIDYTTLELHIREVERTAVVEKQGAWQEIGTNLKNNFVIVGEALVDLFVFFVSAIPFFLPLGAVLAVVLILTRVTKVKKKRAKEKNEERK